MYTRRWPRFGPCAKPRDRRYPPISGLRHHQCMSRPSPTVRRRRIAAELKRLREERGLTLDHAARELGVARSTMSRIENAQVSVRPGDVRTLLELYGLEPDDVAALVQVARDARQRGWWQAYSDVLPGWFEVYVGLEQAASEISTFEVALAPGLLQTPDYARAAIGVRDSKDPSGPVLVFTRSEWQRSLPAR